MTLPADTISRLLSAELAELRNFRSLLAEEQSLLQRGDAEELSGLTGKKSALAARLGELLHEREKALSSHGFTAGREGMESWLELKSTTAASRDDWRELLLLAEEARREHEINGKLIAVQLQNNQQALAALMLAGGRPLTYGPDGQQRVGGGGRNLGSA